MIILSGDNKINGSETAVALGIFDGVHRGHRAVIDKAATEASENGLSPAVCTFKTSTISTKGSTYRPIYSDETKLVLLEKEGIEYVFIPDFADVKDMSPEEFVKDILCRILNARIVVCGRDFRFGKNAACSAEGLGEMCGRLGMKLCVVDDVTENGVRICSADIRRYISEGNIRKANILLGHDYAVVGKVIHGRQLGRKMNFPTANQLMPEGNVMPKFGVYASYAELDGKVYRGITNIGVKPTVESSGVPLAETHFPKYSGDLYGKDIVVRLSDFIRPEKRFNNTDELRAQINNDVNKVMTAEMLSKL